MNEKRNRKARFGIRHLLIIGIAFILLLYMAFVYKEYVTTAAARPGEVLKVTGMMKPAADVTKGQEIRQSFTVEDETFSAIGVKLGTYGRENTNTLQITLEDGKNGEVLQEWEQSCAGLADNQTAVFPLDKPVRAEEEREFLLCLESEDASADNAVAVFATDKDLYRDGKLQIGKDTQKGDLAFSLIDGDQSYLKSIFWKITMVFAILLCAVYAAGYWKKARLENMFLITAFGLGALYLFVMPPLSAPDEPAHFCSAYAYVNQLTGQERTDGERYTWVREEDMDYNEGQIETTAYTYYLMEEKLFEKADELERVPYASRALNGSYLLVYLPQIAGIFLGKILELGAIGLLLLGRICAFLFYTACCYVAIRKIPFGKMILFATAILPMSMELATSYSYDCVLNGLSFLFVGYVLYMAYEKQKVSAKDWALLAVISVVLIPIKIIYFPILFLCFFVNRKKAKNNVNYYGGIATVFGAGTAALLATRLAAIGNYMTRDAHVAGGSESAGHTVGEVLSDIPGTIRLVLRTLEQNGDGYLKTMIGGNLSWLNTELPWILVLGFVILLLLAAIGVRNSGYYQKAWEKLVMSGAAVVVILAILGVFLLTWTPLESLTIQGVQGRYFLSVLPLLLLSLRTRALTLERSADRELIIGAVCLHFFVIWQVFVLNILR